MIDLGPLTGRGEINEEDWFALGRQLVEALRPVTSPGSLPADVVAATCDDADAVRRLVERYRTKTFRSFKVRGRLVKPWNAIRPRVERLARRNSMTHKQVVRDLIHFALGLVLSDPRLDEVIVKDLDYVLTKENLKHVRHEIFDGHDVKTVVDQERRTMSLDQPVVDRQLVDGDQLERLETWSRFTKLVSILPNAKRAYCLLAWSSETETEKQLATRFGVSPATVRSWRRRDVIKIGSELC